MSESGFRWVLLIVGIIILVIIYLLGKRSRSRPPRDLIDEATQLDDDMNLAFRVDDEEPEFDVTDFEGTEEESHSYVQSLNALHRRESKTRVSTGTSTPKEQNVIRPEKPAPSAELPEKKRPLSNPTEKITPILVRREKTVPSTDRREKIAPPVDMPEKIVILHVVASDSSVFTGASIMQVVEQLDLVYDARGILFRPIERSGKRQALFNVASMVKPGLIPLDSIETFTTPGLSLFLQLPGPEEGLKSFNAMWDCAQGLATLLEGDIQDQAHSSVSSQTIDRLREEIQLFSLRQSTPKRVN